MDRARQPRGFLLSPVMERFVRGPAERALLDADRLNSERWRELAALTALRADVLSEEARKQRRNLLAAGTVAVIVTWLDLVPREISALGVRLEADDRQSFRWALMMVLGFFLVSFLVHAATDVTTWFETRREVGRTTAIAGEREHAAREHLLGVAVPAIQRVQGDEEKSAERAESMLKVVDMMFEAGEHERAFRRLAPLADARALLEFGVPLAVGIVGLVLLALEIA